MAGRLVNKEAARTADRPAGAAGGPNQYIRITPPPLSPPVVGRCVKLVELHFNAGVCLPLFVGLAAGESESTRRRKKNRIKKRPRTGPSVRKTNRLFGEMKLLYALPQREIRKREK